MPVFLRGFCPVFDRLPLISGSIRFPHGRLLDQVPSLRVVLGRRENAMPTYRVYLINASNRVASFRAIDAETDAEALKAARQFVDGCDVEVWHLDRKIGRLDHGKGRP
jgi:hypothetical protein